MARCFKQLNLEDRLTMYHLLLNGVRQTEISKRLGVHRSTITREIVRNNWGLNLLKLDNSSAFIAQRMTQTRRQRPLKLSREPYEYLKNFVIEMLQKSWSPGQISGYLKTMLGYCSISHEAIYRYIFSEEGKKLGLHKYLRTRRKRRIKLGSRKRGKPMTNKKSIHERPDYINNRSEFGHWEADLMVFNRSSRQNLLTLRERQSRYVIAIRNYSRTAKKIRSSIEYMFGIRSRNLPLKSITIDNGFEWSDHQKISGIFGINLYFCDPSKPYQKGSVENAHHFLREFFPKGTSIDKIPEQDIQDKIELFNRRPMRCLGYRTPEKVFYDKVKEANWRNVP